MLKQKYSFAFSSFLLLLIMHQDAIAGVVADRSRIIFTPSQREQGLSLVNYNDYPVIVQLWVDDGSVDSGPDVANAPILPHPGLLRFAPKEHKHISLLNISENAPEKQEQLYWLNLYEVPPSPSKNDDKEGQLLIVTLRTQMKVFVRPDKMAITSNEIAKYQTFSFEGSSVNIENNTPYFVTYQNVSLNINGVDSSIYNGMLPPYSVSSILVKNVNHSNKDSAIVNAEYIDDDGNVQQFSSHFK
ncbi:fimbrial biogenesis chaperone [Shewanella baltica]|uniref:fimbrial biogenesis chaperone n=1 Tax=Shewanella baltica TaxID=62322 RepID=UPI003D7B7984